MSCFLFFLYSFNFLSSLFVLLSSFHYSSSFSAFLRLLRSFLSSSYFFHLSCNLNVFIIPCVFSSLPLSGFRSFPRCSHFFLPSSFPPWFSLISCSFFLILPCPSSSLPFRVHLFEGNFHDPEELITRSRNSMKCLMLWCLQRNSADLLIALLPQLLSFIWETHKTIIGVISYLRIRQPLLTTTIRGYGNKLQCVLSFFVVLVVGTHN